jgi:hypothetical protein
VHSKGFNVEYAEMLADELIKFRGKIGILTDFDATGINIGLKIKGAIRKIPKKVKGKDGKLYDSKKEFFQVRMYENIPKRLGIDAETLQSLDLSANALSENALDKKGEPSNHWLGLLNTLKGIKKRHIEDEWTEEQKDFYFTYLTEKHKELGEGRDGKGVSYIEFLRDRRIELDTVVNEVGAQRFWEWLKDRILKTFDTWDYNRAITVPSYVATPTIEEFQKRFEALIKSVTSNRCDEIIDELRNVDELLDTDGKAEDIKKDLLNNHILKNAKVKRIDKALQKLFDELPEAEKEE